MSGDDSGSDKSKPLPLHQRLTQILGHGQESLTTRVKDWDARKTLDEVLDAHKTFKRECQNYGSTSVIKKFRIDVI